ncbi:hypothetical protein N7470_001349 [Penicillium chermesinum]|nr:hypothetical protein N7470_001349 [Penicillium chermesinum]
MFYDLNVPYAPDDPGVSHTLNFLAELGYTTVALSQTVSGKLPPNIVPPEVPRNPPKSLQLLTRVNLTLSDPAQNQRLNALGQAYDLVAIRPTNEKSLLNACTNLECDIISLDLSVRQPYHFKFKMLSAAVSRGDSHRDMLWSWATRGRGIIVSSEARRALSLRAPWDVINLTCVWGLSQEVGKEAICEEARKVTALAKLKRTSWRGIVDIVHGGESTKSENLAQKPQTTNKRDTRSAEDHGSEGLKRKASTSSEVVPETLEKPISKREQKRRAKKAKLEANGPDAK